MSAATMKMCYSDSDSLLSVNFVTIATNLVIQGQFVILYPVYLGLGLQWSEKYISYGEVEEKHRDRQIKRQKHRQTAGHTENDKREAEIVKDKDIDNDRQRERDKDNEERYKQI